MFLYMLCVMFSMDGTTIRVKKETRDRLKAIGRKDETYDDIINRLLNECGGG